MRIVKRTFGMLSMVLFFSLAALGQEILRNSGVVEMVKSGLPQEIIIAKIKASTVSFDVSTEALKALTDAGVPPDVVITMINENAKVAKADAQVSKERAEIRDSVPEQGKLSDLLDRSKVFILTEDIKGRDIIVKELSKIKKFKVVDRIEDSDFVITYKSWTESVGVSATVIGNTATARENFQLIGIFTILMPTEDPSANRVRQVYQVRKSKYFVWEDNPAESATKQFVKDITRAATLAPKKSQ